MNKDDEKKSWDDMKGKVIGLYFSAHWVRWCTYCVSYATVRRIQGEGNADQTMHPLPCSLIRDVY